MGGSRKGKDARRISQGTRETEAKSGKPSTSRSREESMEQSGQDDFQNPRNSGSTGLAGESRSSGSVREPGGVEGADGAE
jgi:hypothetical protein